MASVSMYFQVHQPYRLKDYSFFRIGTDHNYGHTQQNYAILQRVADLCYLPANELMLKLIQRHEGAFKITYSISGTLLEQLRQFRPDVLESFAALAQTGCVEFLNETHYHSLAYLFSQAEFDRQIQLHADRIHELIGYKPTAFRNTELIYDDALPALLSTRAYTAILAEGVDANLAGLPVTGAYRTADGAGLVLPRNYNLSDDLAFRFADSTWSEYPLASSTYAGWLADLAGRGAEAINIYLDYETFGEHRRRETGIFDFIESLPAAVLATGSGLAFDTPSGIATRLQGRLAELPIYAVPQVTSWADAERNLAAWTADNMQKDALNRIYALEHKVLDSSDANILEVWSRLQTSDHFYYMSTQFWGDEAHRTFSPYTSPYDAYINYMNVLTDFEGLVG